MWLVYLGEEKNNNNPQSPAAAPVLMEEVGS